MAQLRISCPHCITERVAFTAGGIMPVPNTSLIYIALLQCGVCGEGVIARLLGDVSGWMNGRGSITIDAVYPSRSSPQSPEFTPDNVRTFYLQGMDNLARKNFDAAGSMFRKTLDTALKALHPEGRGTLAKRIDELPAEKGATPAMREWAHHIRALGNDAAHEDDPFSESDAQSVQAFTELFLTYAFTLPERLVARKRAATGV